jgi:hypothetical protein
MRRIKLSPAEVKKYNAIAIEETWKEVLKDDPKYGPQFKKLSIR